MLLKRGKSWSKGFYPFILRDVVPCFRNVFVKPYFNKLLGLSVSINKEKIPFSFSSHNHN